VPEKIPSGGWCPGSGNLSQNGQKPASLMTSTTNIRSPKLSNSF